MEWLIGPARNFKKCSWKKLMGQLLTNGKPQEMIPNSSPLSITAIQPNVKGERQKVGVSCKKQRKNSVFASDNGTRNAQLP
jgi:hypothetical protein